MSVPLFAEAPLFAEPIHHHLLVCYFVFYHKHHINRLLHACCCTLLSVSWICPSSKDAIGLHDRQISTKIPLNETDSYQNP